LQGPGTPGAAPAIPFRFVQDTVDRLFRRGELGRAWQSPHRPAVVKHDPLVLELEDIEHLPGWHDGGELFPLCSWPPVGIAIRNYRVNENKLRDQPKDQEP